jgi:hypothetical protein
VQLVFLRHEKVKPPIKGEAGEHSHGSPAVERLLYEFTFPALISGVRLVTADSGVAAALSAVPSGLPVDSAASDFECRSRLAELVLCLLLSPLSGLLSLLGLLLSLYRSLLLVLLRLILRSGQRLGKFILYLLLTSLLSLLRLPGLLCLSSLLRDLLVLLILLFAFRFGQVTAPPLLVFTPRLNSLGFAQV